MVFLPVTAVGWIIFLSAFASCIYLFISIDSRSHSASDTLINFAFNALIVAAVYSLVAYFASRRTAA